MHITDGILSGEMVAATSVLAVVGVGLGLRKLDYQEIPKVGLLASGFFMASFVNVPIGPVHTHLLLCGLMGMLLGWRSFVALLAAMVLQAVLFGIGGLSSLGVNVLVMGSSAVVCYYLFGVGDKQVISERRLFVRGFMAGVVGVGFAAGLVACVLLMTGSEFMRVVEMVLLWHVPVMVVEGFVTGWAVVLLGKVRPEILTGSQEQEDAAM